MFASFPNVLSYLGTDNKKPGALPPGLSETEHTYLQQPTQQVQVSHTQAVAQHFLTAQLQPLPTTDFFTTGQKDTAAKLTPAPATNARNQLKTVFILSSG
jgi:hypothetical protein